MHNMKRIALSALAAAALSVVVSGCKDEAKAPPAAPPPANTPPPATPPPSTPPPAATNTPPPAAGATTTAGGSASITGSVLFSGAVPEMKKLASSADAKCPKTVIDESALVKGGKLENVWIHVTKGAPAGAAVATTPVEVTQEGCMYKPRVQFVQVGQKITVKNHDDTLHNVHTYLGATTAFNKAMPGKAAPAIDYTPSDEGMIKWKCDVHPWMRGFIGVAKTNLQATTGDLGDFKIDNVPPGTYTIEAWHEKFGTKTAEVTVEAGKPAKIDFKYDGTEKGS